MNYGRVMKTTWHKLWLLPPALLALVATVQPLLVYFQNFDRWEGGGFGMFASVDRESLRSYRLFVGTEEGELPAFFVDFEVERKRLVTMPNTSLLDREIELLADSKWCLCESLGPCVDEIAKNSVEDADLFEALSSSAKMEPLPYDRYKKVLVPYVASKCNSASHGQAGELRLEVRRLVYHGEGRYGTAILNGATSQ